MDNLTVANKPVKGQAEDTDIAAADGDTPRLEPLYRLHRLHLEKLHRYVASYAELRFPPLFSYVFSSVPTSADAGAIQMRWGNWAKILSSISVKPFTLTQQEPLTVCPQDISLKKRKFRVTKKLSPMR